MTIRLLQPDDVAAFQAIRLRGLQEIPGAFAASYEEETDLPLTKVAERLGPLSDRAVFGAWEGETLAGVTGLERENLRKLAHKALIWGVYVAPEFRGRGLGRDLMQAALQHAFAWPGLRQVNLGVHAANEPARRLYESLGFEPFGLERDCLVVNGVPQDELHMVHFGKSGGL